MGSTRAGPWLAALVLAALAPFTRSSLAALAQPVEDRGDEGGSPSCLASSLSTQGSGFVQAKSMLHAKASKQELQEKAQVGKASGVASKERAQVGEASGVESKEKAQVGKASGVQSKESANGHASFGDMLRSLHKVLDSGSRPTELGHVFAHGVLGICGLLVVSSAVAILFSGTGKADSREVPKVEGAHGPTPPRSPIIKAAKASKASHARHAEEWQLSLPIVRAAASAAADKGKGIPLVASPTICPGLVVPNGCECRLVLPVSAFAEPTADGLVINIAALNGETLIQCTLNKADWSVAELRPVALLHPPASSSDEKSAEEPSSPLAYCKAGADTDGYRTAYIYNAQDELLAQVTPLSTDDQHPRFVLESGRTRMFFQGEFNTGAVEILSEQGERLAIAQPQPTPSTGCELRVGADADVGAVLCGLFIVCQMSN